MVIKYHKNVGRRKAKYPNKIEISILIKFVGRQGIEPWTLSLRGICSTS